MQMSLPQTVFGPRNTPPWASHSAAETTTHPPVAGIGSSALLATAQPAGFSVFANSFSTAIRVNGW